MSSKTLQCLFTAGVLSFCLGCGLNLGEKAPEPAPLSLDGRGYSCIGQIAENVQAYVRDELSEDEINAFVGCLQKAFVNFAQLTRGSDGGKYHPNEIRKFIERYFLKDQVISDSLLHEFMVLKQVFVGGDDQRISKLDLQSVVSILEDIRVEALRLKPHLKVLNYNLKRPPEHLGLSLRQAQDALNQTIRTFSSRIARSKKVYRYENLSKLMTEFRDFSNWEQHFPEALPTEYWVNFIKIFSELSMGRKAEGFSADDWNELLRSFSHWYMVILQYRLGVQGQNLLSGVGFENIRFLADEFFRLIEDTIHRQPESTVTYEQLNQLFLALKDLNWLPGAVRVQSINQLAHILFDRVFSSPSLGVANPKSPGLDLYVFSQMNGEFQRWANIQAQLIEQYEVKPSIDSNSELILLSGPRRPRASRLVSPKLINSLVGVNNSEWTEFSRVQSLMRPLYAPASALVWIVKKRDFAKYKVESGFHDLSAKNLLRTLVGLLFRGYSTDRVARWDAMLTDSQLQQFYKDFFDFGVDLGLVDRRSQNAGLRAFIEANTFTFAANGVERDEAGASSVQFPEVMELLAFLYSGSRMNQDVVKSLRKVCPEVGPLDQYGNPTLSRSCVSQHVVWSLTDYSENLPALREFVKRLTPTQQVQLGEIWLAMAYSQTNSDPQWIESAELCTVNVINHYIETILLRFDKNENGHLENHEVSVAAPIFYGLIDYMTQILKMGELWEWQKTPALKYILVEKDIPAGTWDKIFIGLKKAASYVPGYWLLDSDGFSAFAESRKDLNEVFMFIMRKMAISKKEPVPLKVRPCMKSCPWIQYSGN